MEIVVLNQLDMFILSIIVVSAIISLFSAGFLFGSKQLSPSASQLWQAFIILLRCFEHIFDPVTMDATFCSSVTFHLINSSISG